MAWERKFEERVIKVRGKELKYLKLTYLTEVNSLISLLHPSLKHRFNTADFIDRRLVCLYWIPNIFHSAHFCNSGMLHLSLLLSSRFGTMPWFAAKY